MPSIGSMRSNEEDRRICRFGDRDASGYDRPARDRSHLRSTDGRSPSQNASAAGASSARHRRRSFSSCSRSAARSFLQLLQVSMPAFEVAAGILLLLQSIELIFARPGGLSTLTVGEEEEAELSDEIAVFPLAIPLIAGPASITAAMLLMGQAGGDLLKIAVFFLVLLIALAITYVTLMLVEPLGRILGVT